MEVVGLCILDFCLANKLAITNTFFRKNKSSLISFLSGGNHTQIAFILLRRARVKSALHNTKTLSVVSAKTVKPIRIPLRSKT